EGNSNSSKRGNFPVCTENFMAQVVTFDAQQGRQCRDVFKKSLQNITDGAELYPFFWIGRPARFNQATELEWAPRWNWRSHALFNLLVSRFCVDSFEDWLSCDQLPEHHSKCKYIYCSCV